MKNKIKKILDRLDYDEWEVDLYKVPITWCELYDIRDYITNLERENKVLLEKYSTIQILYNSSKLKNDKAIEYIENENICREELPKYVRIEINNFDKKYRNDLLNILQGGDK